MKDKILDVYNVHKCHRRCHDAKHIYIYCFSPFCIAAILLVTCEFDHA